MNMNGKWIKIVLIASLALNVAFFSTAVYRKLSNRGIKKIPRPEKIIDKDFQLNPDQKEKIKKIIKTFELKLMEYKQNILDQRIAIIETLSDPDFNLEDIEEKTDRLNKLENQLNILFVDTLGQVNSLLEPQQRFDFLYRLSKNWFFIPRISPGIKPGE